MFERIYLWFATKCQTCEHRPALGQGISNGLIPWCDICFNSIIKELGETK